MFIDSSDWKIQSEVIEPFLKDREIDLFATRLTNQLPRYVSWRPGPHIYATDMFSIVSNAARKSFTFNPTTASPTRVFLGHLLYIIFSLRCLVYILIYFCSYLSRYMVLSVVMLILITFVKTELCRELLEVLALSRFSCIAGFFLASLIIQP